jgi:three-Cys-motif partner protein
MGKKRSRDRWPDLRSLVEQDDGMVAREVGHWSEQKLWFWARYVDITTTAMVGSPKWPAGVVYVDLFSGPGVCQVKESGRRFPGSPLIAAHATKPFTKLLLCEKDRKAADACKARLLSSPSSERFMLFHGDCNECVDDIVSNIPDGALTLAFIDPTGLHAEIATIQKLAANRRVDLVVLFPDAMDAVRNAEAYYFQNPDSNLDRVLGADSNWREDWQNLGTHERSAVCRWFSDIYRRQLARVAGYDQFGEEVIRGPQGPLYRLLFASKHPRGLEFWSKVTKRELGGQGRMF